MEQKYKEIIKFLINYQEKTNVKGYVINISGGKDSTIVAKLLCDAIGSENVYGVLQPCYSTKDIKTSIDVCKLLNINYSTISISDAYCTMLNKVYLEHHDLFLSDLAKINIQPRLRMINAYAIAQTLGYRVAGTGNKSEEFIGWCTKWGDMACDINPIAHLLCTEVIELGDFLNLPKELVHKIPADGLTNRSDETNFGFTYKKLDEFIKLVELDRACNTEISPLTICYDDPDYMKIINMHLKSRHKHKPYTL